jgi:hypothetical protein
MLALFDAGPRNRIPAVSRIKTTKPTTCSIKTANGSPGARFAVGSQRRVGNPHPSESSRGQPR